MQLKQRSAIKTYQCPGCISGPGLDCYQAEKAGGIGCMKHAAATIIFPNVGKVFLGLPKGFNRLGPLTKMRPIIFESFDKYEWKYDMWNVPVWKYKNALGHTIVRGLMPRLNEPFLHIFLEDCMHKIYCYEITQSDIERMD